MMKKNILSLILVFVILAGSIIYFPLEVLAEPSSWATEEVAIAREKNLIPYKLDNNYQANIKRYEYVLIALQLMELKYVDVEIVQEFPFTDIDGHQYENEIIAAYNAGIIKGDGNGKFRPNDTITRQEIASLVYNLVKVLRDSDLLATATGSPYYDQASIGTWALQYINYCYDNDIMKGVGKDALGRPIINPLGTATREQAFVLLYRLGVSEGILKDYNYNPIQVKIGDTYETSTKINLLANVLGPDFAEEIISLSRKTFIDVVTIGEAYVALEYKDEGKVFIDKSSNDLKITVTLESLDISRMQGDIYDLAELAGAGEAFQIGFTRSITGFSADDSFYYQDKLSDEAIITAESFDTEDGILYQIRYVD